MTTLGENISRATVSVAGDAEQTIELSWFALTDVGHRRESNQDSFLVQPPVFAVADGMGGHSLGEVASGAVVRSLSALADAKNVSREDIIDSLSRAVDTIELDAADMEWTTRTTGTPSAAISSTIAPATAAPSSRVSGSHAPPADNPGHVITTARYPASARRGAHPGRPPIARLQPSGPTPPP